MIDTRGAMTATAQQFYADVMCRGSLRDFITAELGVAEEGYTRRKVFEFADALSAHNTAELRGALEAEKKRLVDECVRGRSKDKQIRTLEERLRSQGAGQPEAAAKEICELLSFTDLTNVYEPERYKAQVVAIIRKHSGLASPPEGHEAEILDFIAHFDCPCCKFPNCGHQHESNTKAIMQAEIARQKGKKL